MRTPRRPTAERRAELADAALAIIATRGIAALTTRTLAEAVGLTTGAIFRHFASLDALLVAVAERVEQVLASTYPPTTLAPRARLEGFVAARSAAVGEHVGILRLMLSEQFALALPAAAARRRRAAVVASQTFLTTTIAEAQAAGELRQDLAPEVLAVIVMGTIQLLGLASTRPHAGPARADAVRVGLARLLAPPTGPDRRRKR